MKLRWALWYNSAHGYFVAHSANDSANGNNTATAPLTYAAMYFAKKYLLFLCLTRMFLV